MFLQVQSQVDQCQKKKNHWFGFKLGVRPWATQIGHIHDAFPGSTFRFLPISEQLHKKPILAMLMKIEDITLTISGKEAKVIFHIFPSDNSANCTKRQEQGRNEGNSLTALPVLSFDGSSIFSPVIVSFLCHRRTKQLCGILSTSTGIFCCIERTLHYTSLVCLSHCCALIHRYFPICVDVWPPTSVNSIWAPTCFTSYKDYKEEKLAFLLAGSLYVQCSRRYQ